MLFVVAAIAWIFYRALIFLFYQVVFHVSFNYSELSFFSQIILLPIQYFHNSIKFANFCENFEI